MKEKSKTVIFKLPKPGDSLPFEVGTYYGTGIWYNKSGDLIAVDGYGNINKDGNYPRTLHDLFGLPLSVYTNSVVGIKEEDYNPPVY